MITTPFPDPSPEPRTAGDAGPTSSAPPLLIGDADRARAQDRLSRSVGLGELGLEEFDDRLQAVLRARTDVELRRLLVDLPSAAGVLHDPPTAWSAPTTPTVPASAQVPVRPTPVSRSSTRARPTPTGRSPRSGAADAWVRWAALAALLIVVWLAVGIPTGAWYPWPIWPILGTAVCAVRQTVGQSRVGRARMGA